MKNVKNSRRKIKKYLEGRNIFDVAIQHNGGRQVVLSMPPTTEAKKFIQEISKNQSSSIKCSNGTALEVKAPSLNYLRNFFRRKLVNAEPVLD